mgnify:FL=1|jgi:tRNA-dihydrouridine synthase
MKKNVLAKNMRRFGTKNLVSENEAQQSYYEEVIKNNEWDSYEDARDWLENQGLNGGMIDSILDKIYPKD